MNALNEVDREKVLKQARFLGSICMHEEEMTIRIYLAAQALAGGLEQGVCYSDPLVPEAERMFFHHPKDIAKRAFEIADAILVEAQFQRNLKNC